jgi:hypothetical protein
MVLPYYAIPGIGAGLDGAVLWRLSLRHHIKRYPYFATFLFFDLLRTAVAVAVFHFRREWYARTYWDTEAIALVLLFAIAWEVARNLFPTSSTLRRLAWKIVVLAEAILVPVLSFLAWGWSRSDFHEYPVLLVWPIVEQYFALAVSILLLIISGVARYYGVAFGRNLRGLVGGFGVYLCMYAANFAALQIIPRFHLFWQLLSSLAYGAMAASWLWAFWEYAPPLAPPAIRQEDLTQYRRHWENLWRTTMGLLRRSVN